MDTSAEFPASPFRTAMTVGAFVAALMLAASALGLQILGWIVFAGGVYYGMKRFRKEARGSIGYSGALTAGILTAFFASVVCAFFVYLSTTLEPSLIDTMLHAAEQQLQTSGMPSGMVEDATLQLRKILSPVVLAIFAIMGYTTIGLFASIVCAFFVRNEQPRSKSLNS